MAWGREMKPYFEEIKDIPLLTPEEEKQLFRQLRKNGDLSVRDKIAKSNLRLVISIAKRYQHMGLPLDDLIEEGSLGLLKAIEKFDLRRNCKFATYASFWIRQSVTRALTNEGKLIRLPAHITSRLSKMRKISEKLRQDFGREPTDEEIASEIKLSPREVYDLKSITSSYDSLDSPIGEDGSGQLLDIIVDKSGDGDTVFSMERIAKIIRYDSIMNLIGNLPERESTVLRLRFGLEDGVFRTLDEVGKELSLTRERIRQIEMSAIKKLRHSLASKQQGEESGRFKAEDTQHT